MAMIGGTLRWGAALLTGFLGAQMPEFSQQYAQRLGGAVDELGAIVARFDAAAGEAGLSRHQALLAYDASEQPFLKAQGEDMAQVLARYTRLEAHLEALRTDGTLMRYIDLARYYDPQIAQGTFSAYRPAVPTTVEGLALAGTCALFGYAGVAIGGRTLRRRRRRAA